MGFRDDSCGRKTRQSGNGKVLRCKEVSYQMSRRVQMLPKTVISRYSNTYAKKPKRVGVGKLPLSGGSQFGRLHILEYLVERKYDEYSTYVRVRMRP